VAGLVFAQGSTPLTDTESHVLVVQASQVARILKPTGDRVLTGRLGDAFVSGRFVREAELVRARAADSPPLLLEYSLTAQCAEPSALPTAQDVPAFAGSGVAAEAKQVFTVSVRPAPTATGTVLRVRAPVESEDADGLSSLGACGDAHPTTTRLLLPAPHRTKI